MLSVKRIIPAAAVACLALLGCREEAPKDGKPMVTIGVIYPMSGDMAKYGEAAKAAAEIFFEEFNKEDRRFEYRLIWEDNQGKPAVANMAAQRLISLEKSDALISLFSHLAAPVARLAERHKTCISWSPPTPLSGRGGYNFAIGADPDVFAEKLHEELVKRRAKKVSAVSSQAAGPLPYIEAFKNVVEDRKELVLTGDAYVNPGERDFRTLAWKIKMQDPDYIYVKLLSPEIDIFVRQLKEQDVAVPVVGVAAFTLVHNLAPFEGMWEIGTPPPDPRFAALYFERTKQKNDTQYAEIFYTMLDVMTHAYETVGEKDAGRLAEAILGIKDFPTAAGTVSVDGTKLIAVPPAVRKVVNGEIIAIGEGN